MPIQKGVVIYTRRTTKYSLIKRQANVISQRTSLKDTRDRLRRKLEMKNHIRGIDSHLNNNNAKNM